MDNKSSNPSEGLIYYLLFLQVSCSPKRNGQTKRRQNSSVTDTYNGRWFVCHWQRLLLRIGLVRRRNGYLGRWEPRNEFQGKIFFFFSQLKKSKIVSVQKQKPIVTLCQNNNKKPMHLNTFYFLFVVIVFDFVNPFFVFLL